MKRGFESLLYDYSSKTFSLLAFRDSSDEEYSHRTKHVSNNDYHDENQYLLGGQYEDDDEFFADDDEEYEDFNV